MNNVLLPLETEATSTSLDPSKEIRVRLLWKIDQLQMLPSLAVQALEIANSSEGSIKDFTTLVEQDMTLAADMLRMANSMVYSRGTPMLSLHQAVVRLGFRQCKNLILASSANSLMMQLTAKEEHIRKVMWSHSFLTASMASFLNRAMNFGFQGEEFIAGLIHDIGRILLALVEPSRFPKADRMDFEESGNTVQATILDRERCLLGTDHCAMGAWFVEYSGLPISLADVVRHHHNFSRDMANRPLTALTAVADHMANHLQRHGSPEGYDPETNLGLDYLARTHSQRHRLVEILPTVMEDAISNTGDF